MEAQVLNALTVKFLTGFLLCAAWYSFILLGKVPANDFIDMAKLVVPFLVGFHMGSPK